MVARCGQLFTPSCLACMVRLRRDGRRFGETRLASAVELPLRSAQHAPGIDVVYHKLYHKLGVAMFIVRIVKRTTSYSCS